MQKTLVVLAALAANLSLFGAVTMTAGTASSRSTYPRSLSGITYAGGNTYYAVADDNGPEGGLYAYSITLSEDGKSVVSGASVSTNSVVKLPGTYDLEGIAFDPASGNVWAADETRETIKEYDPKTGAVVSELAVPSIIKDYNVGNYGMESLAISGDGLTMWTANEEALTCDGERASPTNTTTVRLVKFVRETVKGKFRLEAMYPYTTDKLLHETCEACRHGVADIVALPDDSLLVLERDYSKWGSLRDDFAYSIYRVTAADMAAATEIKDIPSLKTAAWTAVRKTKVVEDINLKFVNYEGLCLGPRLSNGNVSLLLVSDAGDGSTNSKILPFVLSGLDIRTLDFPPPASGDSASIEGTNYRFLNGATVSVDLSGAGLAPTAYTNRGDRVASASWALATSGRKGTGPSASFTVQGDDRLVWTVNAASADTPVVGYDTFEDLAVGTLSETIPSWGENGTVVETAYAAPSVGTPMQRATHTKVLSVEDTISRTYAPSSETRQQLDLMVRAVRPVEDPGFDVSAHQGGIAVLADGRVVVYYADGRGGVTHSVALERTFADGEWIRVTMAFDYAASPAVFTLRLNGDYCGMYPCIGGKSTIAGLDVFGNTMLDDVLLTDGEPDFEIAADPLRPSTRPDGLKVPSAWLDRHGLAWQDLESDVDGDGLRVWQEYLAGSSPLDKSSGFAITDFKVDGNSVAVTFSGELPRPDLLTLTWCTELGGAQSTVSGTVTSEGGVSVWRATVPENARFFRAFLAEK